MAQSKNFFGMRRGSTKTFTFQVNHGVQITKDRVYDVANPRTNAQMGQRLAFANAVKFYKAANQNLFKFAYEDKKPNESDYNAFMRHNTGLAAVASKKMLVNDYPALGNYMLTAGVLGALTIQMIETSDSTNPALTVAGIDEALTVGAAWQKVIAQYPALQNGDIVSLVEISNKDAYNVQNLQEAIDNDALSIFADGVKPTLWHIEQIRIDVTDDTLVQSAQSKVFNWQHVEGYDNELFLNSSLAAANRGTAYGVALIFSRPISASEVKVTMSSVVCDESTQTAINIGRGAEWKSHVAETYEYNPDNIDADAILKGELVSKAALLDITYPSEAISKTGYSVAGTINRAQNVNAETASPAIVVEGSAGDTMLIFDGYAMYNGVLMAHYSDPANEVGDAYMPISGTSLTIGNIYAKAKMDGEHLSYVGYPRQS